MFLGINSENSNLSIFHLVIFILHFNIFKGQGERKILKFIKEKHEEKLKTEVWGYLIRKKSWPRMYSLILTMFFPFKLELGGPLNFQFRCCLKLFERHTASQWPRMKCILAINRLTGRERVDEFRQQVRI